MANTYPISCSCSQIHHVPSTEAGRFVDCSCGNRVEIPTLRQLRMTAGEPTVSVELELGEKLKEKLLPEEVRCLQCDVPTDELAFTYVQCEGISIKSGNKSMFAMLFFFVGPIWAFLYRAQFDEGREYGKHVAYQLPLRLCSPCRKRTWKYQVKSIVEKVPLYRRLIGKYPETKISKLTAE